MTKDIQKPGDIYIPWKFPVFPEDVEPLIEQRDQQLHAWLQHLAAQGLHDVVPVYEFFDYFTRTVPYAVYNIAHLVFDDNNASDSDIAFALNYIRENRNEYCADHNVSQGQIELVIAALNHLLTFPEDTRQRVIGDWNEDDDTHP